MLDWSTLILFAAAASILVFMPGPNTLYIITRNVRQGRRAGIVSSLGVQVGTLFHIAAAAAWDLGFLSYLWGTFSGFLHSARIFESEGIRVDALGEMISDISPVIGEMMKHNSDAIQKGFFDNPQSSLETCVASADLILKHAEEAGINSEIPAFTSKFFQKGRDAGYGKQELAALIKIMREKA